jgi:hypothetical protein
MIGRFKSIQDVRQCNTLRPDALDQTIRRKLRIVVYYLQDLVNVVEVCHWQEYGVPERHEASEFSALAQ